MAARHLVALRGDEEQLFAHRHATLTRSVGRTVNASPELIDDACQAAWTILLRAQSERSPALFAWLRTVAVHDGLPASTSPARPSTPSRYAAVSGYGRPPATDLSSSPKTASTSVPRLGARCGALPPRQRQFVGRKAAGFSYEETRQSGGRAAGVTYINVFCE